MAQFFYAARDPEGKRVQGILSADSRTAVVRILRDRHLLPIELRDLREQKQATRTSGKRGNKGRISLVELALFSRTVATMLDAGIPIIATLEDFASQTINRFFAGVLITLKNDIREGSSFSQALAGFPSVFSPLYISMVRSGEESGSLVEVMGELSTELEEQLTLIRKIRQAVSYPVVILSFFIGVVSFVFLYLIPKFQSVFQQFGADLPVFTKIILKVSQFSLKFSPLLLVVLVLSGFFFSWYHRLPRGRRQIDALKFKLPVFGQLLLKISLSRFSRSLATLLKGGVSITVALEIVSKTAGNAVIEETIDRVRKGVIAGELLGREMKKHRVFPSLLVRMVSVGEETGRLDDMLRRIAQFFRDEVDATLSILASILEPILIIGLGVIVGIVIMAIYLPIFKLAATMH